jgi:hypothetical protein
MMKTILEKDGKNVFVTTEPYSYREFFKSLYITRIEGIENFPYSNIDLFPHSQHKRAVSILLELGYAYPKNKSSSSGQWQAQGSHAPLG